MISPRSSQHGLCEAEVQHWLSGLESATSVMLQLAESREKYWTGTPPFLYRQPLTTTQWGRDGANL
jgi:hypothetical protein